MARKVYKGRTLLGIHHVCSPYKDCWYSFLGRCQFLRERLASSEKNYNIFFLEDFLKRTGNFLRLLSHSLNLVIRHLLLQRNLRQQRVRVRGMIWFWAWGRIRIKIRVRVGINLRLCLTLVFLIGVIVSGANVVHSSICVCSIFYFHPLPFLCFLFFYIFSLFSP